MPPKSKKRGRASRRKRGGSDPASVMGTGSDFLAQQSASLQGRASQAGGSDWALVNNSLGPINSSGVTYNQEFTDLPVPTNAQLMAESAQLAEQYNQPLDGVAPYNPSELYGAPISGGAKKRKGSKKKASKKRSAKKASKKRSAKKASKKRSAKKASKKSTKRRSTKRKASAKGLKMPANLDEILKAFSMVKSKSKKSSGKKRSAKKSSGKKRSAKKSSGKRRSAKRRSAKKASGKRRSAKRRSAKKASGKKRSTKRRK